MAFRGLWIDARFGQLEFVRTLAHEKDDLVPVGGATEERRESRDDHPHDGGEKCLAIMPTFGVSTVYTNLRYLFIQSHF